MLGEEAARQAIGVTVQANSTLLKPGEVFVKVLIRKAAEKILTSNPTGKQSIKTLLKEKTELQEIELDKKDIGGVKRALKKYGVSYSIVKDNTQSNSYHIFFKARDVALIKAALKEYAAKEMQQSKVPIKSRINQALTKYKNQQLKHQQPVKNRDKGAR